MNTRSSTKNANNKNGGNGRSTTRSGGRTTTPAAASASAASSSIDNNELPTNMSRDEYVRRLGLRQTYEKSRNDMQAKRRALEEEMHAMRREHQAIVQNPKTTPDERKCADYRYQMIMGRIGSDFRDTQIDYQNLTSKFYQSI